MQIREALKQAAKTLQSSSTPELDSRLLLAAAMDYTYEQLLLHYDQEIPPKMEQDFSSFIARRQSLEPIAYILGKQEFYSLEFFVSKDVLIPRPDTELLVSTILDDYNENFASEPIHILELGVGSGAISIALAKNIITTKITALDISDKALDIARKNAEFHAVAKQIHFLNSNWYSKIADEKKQYDYIVSNPPYIAIYEKPQMAAETLLFEPELALYADNDGLAAYEIIIASAREHLKDSGRLVLETGYAQEQAVKGIMQKHGFSKIKVKHDLSGHSRVIIG